jgi:hypothetical protein
MSTGAYPEKRPSRRPATDESSPFLLSSHEPEDRRPAIVPRLFVREPGWRAVIKTDSDRLFCYAMAPGEDVYHRIADGELYFQRGDERVCAPCADRLGLLGYAPKMLRQPARELSQASLYNADEYGLVDER